MSFYTKHRELIEAIRDALPGRISVTNRAGRGMIIRRYLHPSQKGRLTAVDDSAENEWQFEIFVASILRFAIHPAVRAGRNLFSLSEREKINWLRNFVASKEDQAAWAQAQIDHYQQILAD